MSSFGQYLQQLIKDRGVSVSRLSRDAEVERTAIHKALTGGRILPYRAVESLSYHLKLSPQESQKLKQYYNQLFESDASYKAREILDNMFSCLNALDGRIGKSTLEIGGKSTLEIGGKSAREMVEKSVGEITGKSIGEGAGLVGGPVKKANKPDKHTYKGYAEIAELLRFLLSEELRYPEPKIELAAPADVKVIEDCIESFYEYGRILEINHIICFDAFSAEGECSLRNLESFCASLPLCILSQRGYRVFYYYNNTAQTSYTDPLPYFMITHSGTVCFSENCQLAIYLQEEEQREYFQECFYDRKQSCHELVEYLENPGQIREQIREADASGEYCAVTFQPCLEKFPAEKLSTLFKRKGILDFLENGKAYELRTAEEAARKPFGQPDPVSAETAGMQRASLAETQERLEALEELLEGIRTGQVRGRILNDMRFLMPEDFGMLVSSAGDFYLFRKDGSLIVRVRESGICTALYDWIVHFVESDRVYDRGETLELGREMVRVWQNRMDEKAQVWTQVEV